jgi:ABC-type branched-subunit amino acid transport system substrate-binding protein
VLNDAGMAAVATKPYTPPDYSTPVVFPVEGGGIAISAGMAEWPAKGGSKHIAAMVFANAGGAHVVQFLTKQLSGVFPGTQLTAINVPVTTSDVTSFAAQAAQGKPDAVILALTENLSISAIQQLRAQGYSGTIVGPSTALPADALKQLGAVGNVQVAGSYAYSSPGYQTFLAEVKAYDPSLKPSDESVNSWLGIHLFAKAMSQSSQPLTRAGVLAAFTNLSNYTTDGLTPALDFTKPNSTQGFSRAFNPTSVLHDVKNGTAADTQPVQFLNIFTGQLR